MTVFREEVDRILAPVLTRLGFRAVFDQQGRAFGDELVEFASDDVRLRIVRDRGQVFADFGSPADVRRFFDAGVVMEHFDPAASWSLQHDTVAESLRAIGRFVEAVGAELRSTYSPDRYRASLKRLDAIERGRADRRFGRV